MRALWALSSGEFERAVDLARQVLASDPSAASHNDLAAALLLHTSAGGSGRDLAEALDHAARAVEMAPDLLEARANLAFALSSFGLDHAADEAWQALEETPLEPLAIAYGRASGTGAHQPETSPIAEGIIAIGSWGESFRSRDEATAATHLARARGLALEAAERGDMTLLDSIEAVRAASPEQRARLAEAHAIFHQVRGSAKYATCDAPLLAAALPMFEAAGTPFAAWVAIDQAICSYFSGNLPKAARELASCSKRWGGDRRPIVGARVDALLGLISMLQGHYADSDTRFAAAIGRYRSFGDLGEALYLQALRARNLGFGGLAANAWDLRLPALRGLSEVGDLERRTTIVQDGVEALEREGLSSAALAVIGEQVAQASLLSDSPTGEIDLLVYTLLRRARLLSAQGRPQEAVRDLRRAETAWEQLPQQQEIRERLAVEISLARAHLGISEPSATENALAFHRTRAPDGQGIRFLVADILQLQAKEARNRGDAEKARDSLHQALEELERQRVEITTPEQRARFSGRSKELVQELVQLLVDDLADPLQALAVWDRYTGRLPVPLKATHSEPASFEGDFTELVPEGALVVRWAELPDRLLIWSIDSSGVELETRETTERELTRLVDSYRAAILSPGTDTGYRKAGTELAQLILPDRVSEARREMRLVFVPSPILQRVPFAALPLHDDSYLIERASLAFAPNLAALADADDEAVDAFSSSQETNQNQFLLVADPAFDTEKFALERLPHAADGVTDAVAGRVLTLSGAAATRSAVLAALDGRHILHAAAHGISDHSFPERGGILLARDQRNPQADLLTAADLADLHDGRLNMVVLATCNSALGTAPETADFLGLASAFLGGGADAVLTTGWTIADQDASTFFRTFYAGLEMQIPGVEALRAAQLSSLRRPEPRLTAPRSWAGYRIDQVEDPWKNSSLVSQ